MEKTQYSGEPSQKWPDHQHFSQSTSMLQEEERKNSDEHLKTCRPHLPLKFNFHGSTTRKTPVKSGIMGKLQGAQKDLKHTEDTTECPKRNKIKFLVAQSRMLWQDPKWTGKFPSVTKLNQFCKEEQNKIPLQQFKRLNMITNFDCGYSCQG